MHSRRNGWLIAVAVFIAMLLVVVFLRQPLGRFVLGRVLTSLGHTLKGRVSYTRIAGDVFAHPKLYGVKIVTEGDSITIDSLDLRYDLLGMLRARFAFSDVTVGGPTVYLSSQRPAPSDSAAKPASRLAFPHAVVGRLVITGGRVFVDSLLRVDSIDLALRMASVPARLSAELIAARGRLAREDVTLQSIRARCAVTPDSVVLTGFEMATQASTVRGDLGLSLVDHGLAATVANLTVSLPECTKLPGQVELAGSGTMRDTLRTATASYSADGLRSGELALPRITGKLTLDNNQLRLDAAGSDDALGGFSIDGRLDIKSLVFSAHARLSGVAVRQLAKTLPDFRANAELDVEGRGIDTVRFSATGDVAELGVDTLSARGSYIGKVLVLDSLEIAGPAGHMVGRGRWRAGRTEAQLDMKGLDAALISHFTTLTAAGRLSGEFRGTGQGDTWSVSGELRANAMKLATVEFADGLVRFDLRYDGALTGTMLAGVESAKVAGIAVDAAQLSLDSGAFTLRVDLPNNRLQAGGTVTAGGKGIDLAVSSFEFATAKETLAVTQPFEFRLHGDSLRLSDVATTVAGGELRLDMLAVGRALPELHFSARHVSLSQLAELAQLSDSVAGLVDMDIEGQDTFAIRLSATDVAVRSMAMRMSSVRASLRASRTALAIDSMKLVSADSGLADTSLIAGRVQYSTDSGFKMTDLDIVAQLRNPGPWVFFFLQPTFTVQQAVLYGDVTLRGNPLGPEMNGRVRVSSALVAMPDLSATIEHVAAELTFDHQRINLQKITGQAGKGSVVANGFVDMGPNWQVDSVVCNVEMSGASVNPQPEIFAVGSGNLRIGWSPVRPMSISGDIHIDEALLAFGFGEPSVPAAGPDTTVLFDVRVRGERNIWLRNQLADVEFSGDLSLRKTRTEMVYSGELDSRQGSIYYLDHTLRVTSGKVTFENINRLNPDLAITAEMPVRAVVRDSSGQTPQKIIITLTGTLEKPVIDLSSDPAGWGAEEIASYLSLNVTPSELTMMDQKEAVSRLLSERLLGYFQTQVSKRARGFVSLDYLEFESGILSGRDTKVTVGKYIGRNLYVTYTQNFTGDLQPVFRVEYYLNRKNEVLAERSEEGRYSLRYQFKLRY